MFVILEKPKKIKLPFKLTEQVKKKLIIVLGVFCLALFLFNYKHLFVVALVNNRPITRLALVRELEKQAGQQVLDTLITKSLILQEADRQNIKIEPERIEEKLKEIEEQVKSQGTDLDTLLQEQGQTRKSLGEEIRIQLIAEEILGKDIEVTEAELQNYFEENKEFLGEDASFEEIKEGLREELKQQKTNERITSWLEELRQNAKINYFLRL